MTCTHVHDCHCPPAKLHLVVAGRNQHAQMVADAFGWKPREWRYVVEAGYLNGYECRNTDIYVYESTYRQHRHADEIMREVDRMQYQRSFQVRWVQESELRVNRQPARRAYSRALVEGGIPPRFDFQDVTLRQMVVPSPANLRIAKQPNAEVHVVQIDPPPPGASTPWTVWYTETRDASSH